MANFKTQFPLGMFPIGSEWIIQDNDKHVKVVDNLQLQENGFIKVQLLNGRMTGQKWTINPNEWSLVRVRNAPIGGRRSKSKSRGRNKNRQQRSRRSRRN